jgi:hypothetical protein
LARFLAGVHGKSPLVLAEHFSGSGALARAWPGTVPNGSSIAIDFDRTPLRKLARAKGVRAVCMDVRKSTHRADVIAATNFPIGYFHTRADLVEYLKHVRSLLNASGVFVCDLYGGSDAYTTGLTRKSLRAPDGTRVTYTWEQRSADPATARVTNALHFKLPARGTRKAREIKDAFVYDWRLWSIPELRDAAAEAGLTDMQIYNRLADAIDSDGNVYVRPIESGADLDDPWVAYVALRPAATAARKPGKPRRSR